MKYLTTLLLALCLIFGCNQLFASNNEVQQLLRHFWTGTDEELYLNIKISDDLEFENIYDIWKVENGLGCEISCRPKPGRVILSDLGEKLREMQFSVVLKNTVHSDEVAFLIITKGLYEADNKLINLSLKQEGTVNSSAIDLRQDPEFFDVYDSTRDGIIVFKNR